MLGHFIVLTFAGLFTWELIRYLVWFEIPPRLAPIVVGFICLMLAIVCTFPLILSLASAGGIAVLHAVTGISGIEPWKFPRIRSRKSKAMKIPELPPDGTRRIPLISQ